MFHFFLIFTHIYAVKINMHGLQKHKHYAKNTNILLTLHIIIYAKIWKTETEDSVI